VTDINITTKICPKCKRELDVGRFSKNTSAKDGLQRRCKDCASEYGRKRFLDKKDDLKKIFTGKPIHKEDLIKHEDFEMGSLVCVFAEDKFVGMYRITNSKTEFAKAEFVMQEIK